jgi:hypothetical protein
MYLYIPPLKQQLLYLTYILYAPQVDPLNTPHAVPSPAIGINVEVQQCPPKYRVYL